MSASSQLFEYLDFLEGEAQQSKTLGSVAKSCGIFCLLSGAITAATLPGWGLFALAGGAVYGLQLLRESRKTGRTMPIPFSEVGIDSIVRGLSKVPSSDSDDLLDYHYLSSQQKSDYALLSICAEELGAMLDQLPPKRQKTRWYQISRRFHQTYCQHVRENPDLVAIAADKNQLMRFLLADADEMRRIQKEASAAIASNTLPEAEENPIGTNTKLNAVEVASQPLQLEPREWDDWDEDPPAEEKQQPDNSMALLREALGYPSVLIFGASGAGKSTLARWFIAERQKLGHSVEILDPHVAFGAWRDLPVYGAGLDYKACNERLGAFNALVQQRYQTLAKKENFNPRPHTVLCEEFTNWAQHCDRAGEFFSSSMSDLRKVNMFALYVAHGRTLTALGGSKGTAHQRDQTLLEIELDVSLSASGRPQPAGTGRIYYPNRKQAPVEITISDLSTKTPDKRPEQPLEAAYSADSSDDMVQLISTILKEAGEPLLASQIRQKKRVLKDQITKDQLDALLNRMAMEGFIRSTDETPARYHV
ncbi:hypothetical protein [Almyronema epifaneia]|uniref:ATP-binding protein n=1 Tax=Almyronema epifaneia S1 TaxID=2991925 RepID=A0ABW6IK01_9CYAN